MLFPLHKTLACLATIMILNAQTGFAKRNKEQDCKSGKYNKEGFEDKGCQDQYTLPQTSPFYYFKNGIRWTNFGRCEFDQCIGKQRMHLPDKNNKHVGIVGGVIDDHGNVLDHGRAYMTLEPKSTTWSFDLDSFSFACLNRQRDPVPCTIGLKTSTSFTLPTQDPILFVYDPKGQKLGTPPWMRKEVVRVERGAGLKMAEIGLTTGRFDGRGKMIPNFGLYNLWDKTMNADGITVIIDDIEYRQHICEDLGKVPEDGLNSTDAMAVHFGHYNKKCARFS